MDSLIASPVGVVRREDRIWQHRRKHSAGTRAPVKYIDSRVITCVPYVPADKSNTNQVTASPFAVVRMDTKFLEPEQKTRSTPALNVTL